MCLGTVVGLLSPRVCEGGALWWALAIVGSALMVIRNTLPMESAIGHVRRVRAGRRRGALRLL